ncbi:DUF4214 domain-containing protein [Pseudoroseomonas ludipueritiae]|uniref:DUF4214 domain-containing protein n=1 Tax=Pseudoroseomonas ludipueritiae TaxID=198093 RepID=UPI0034627A5F
MDPHDTVLGRLPDAQGLTNWRTGLDTGTQSQANMMDGFMASDEFKARYGADTSTTDFVELLYNNALHRASDRSGKATWVGWLDSGTMTRASTVLGFSESAEHVALTVANVMNEDPSHYGIAFA